MIADILFQYHSTTTNSTTTEAELAFQSEDGGVTMINSLWVACVDGSTCNYRIHHCGPDEEPDPANIIILARATSNSSIPNATQSCKIVLNPSDRIFCQMTSGSGVTITGYGLRPMSYQGGSEPQVRLEDLPQSNHLGEREQPPMLDAVRQQRGLDPTTGVGAGFYA